MRTAFLAALLTLPAAADDQHYEAGDLAEAARYVAAHPDFGARFSRRWEEALGGLDSLSEHREFVLKRKSIRLRIVDPGPGGGISRDTVVAMYRDGVVYLNRVALVLSAKDLEARGLPPEEIPELLAWKFLSTLAHEIRHGITRQQLEARAGFFTPILLDDELLAFYDEVRVLKEAIAARPRFWDPQLLLHIDRESGTLLDRWARGGMEAYVRKLYGTKVFALEVGRAGLLRELEKERKRLGEIIAAVDESKKALADPKLPPKERRRLQDFLDAPPSEQLVRDLADQNETALRKTRDPRRWAAFEGYLRKRMDAMRREQKRQNP